jgi:hypothetical protein
VAWLLAGAGPLLFAGINVWTRVHDDPAIVQRGRVWEVLTWELSSAAATLALMWLAARAAVLLFCRPLGSAALAGALSLAFAFFLLHVAAFVAIRSAVYLAVGSIYRFGGWRAWLYELPKDMVTFAILTGVFAAVRVFRAPAFPRDSDNPPREIVVREGGRVHLLRSEEVLAVSAAGNYVELRLAGGRTILWRNSLSEVESALTPMGFIRTHRSWLVNRAHVRTVRPIGSGDREVVISDGSSIPLSRRFGDALPRLVP